MIQVAGAATDPTTGGAIPGRVLSNLRDLRSEPRRQPSVPGPRSLDLLSDATTPASGGRRHVTRTGAKCGDWSKACSGTRSGRCSVARTAAGSGVRRRTRSMARSAGLTLEKSGALSRRCSEAMSMGRSEGRSGIESRRRSRALSGVKTGFRCRHLSPTCSMSGTGFCSGAKASPYDAGGGQSREVVDWPKPLVSNYLG